MRIALCVLGSLILGVSLTGCPEGGTFAGNPILATYGDLLGDPSRGYSVALAQAICTRITQCSTHVAQSNCESRSKQATGIGPQIGIPQDAFNNLGEIQLAEKAGSIEGHFAPYVKCDHEIRALSCTDPVMQRAVSLLVAKMAPGPSSKLTASVRAPRPAKRNLASGPVIETPGDLDLPVDPTLPPPPIGELIPVRDPNSCPSLFAH